MIEKYPLMKNNIIREDLDLLIDFLKQDDPILTQSVNVKAFEEEWSKWLGVKYSVFVNSGASANLITIASLKNFFNDGEIIVPNDDEDVLAFDELDLPFTPDIFDKMSGEEKEALFIWLNRDTMPQA